MTPWEEVSPPPPLTPDQLVYLLCCCFLPLGRKARRTLSGRGGGAPRPPATLSCKADPDDYPAGLALRYGW